MQANPEHELFARLSPVCKRRQTAVLLEGIGRGLLGGLGAAVLVDLLWLGAWAWAWAGLPAVPAVPQTALLLVLVAALLLGPSVGAWLALRRKRDWHAAAAAVDRHYRLHDRAVTALEFLGKSEPKPLEQRQIAQCMEHLESVDPKAVVPVALAGFVMITAIFVVLGAAAIAGPLAVGPIAGPPIEPKPEPSTATVPAGGKPAPGEAATDASLAEAVDWQVAPSGEVKVSRAALVGGVTLEQIVSGADSSASLGQTEGEARRPEAQGREPPEMVLEGEPIPWKHRRSVRRYFESIRPNEHAAPEGPAAP